MQQITLCNVHQNNLQIPRLKIPLQEVVVFCGPSDPVIFTNHWYFLQKVSDVVSKRSLLIRLDERRLRPSVESIKSPNIRYATRLGSVSTHMPPYQTYSVFKCCLSICFLNRDAYTAQKQMSVWVLTLLKKQRHTFCKITVNPLAISFQKLSTLQRITRVYCPNWPEMDTLEFSTTLILCW